MRRSAFVLYFQATPKLKLIKWAFTIKKKKVYKIPNPNSKKDFVVKMIWHNFSTAKPFFAPVLFFCVSPMRLHYAM